MKTRLQKVIARSGIASRRDAEVFILDGRISVNGTIISELGFKVDPEKDVVKLDGKRLKSKELQYVILNKPRGYITSMKVDQKFRTIIDLGVPRHLGPAGRLDYNTEGLILLSNDGELISRIIHPKYHIPKFYDVKIQGILREDDIKKIEGGVHIDGKKTLPIKTKLLSKTDKNQWISLKLYEGRNRIIRRILDSLGYTVLKLKRTQIANLRIDGLKPGTFRSLFKTEIEKLKKQIELS